MSLTPDTTARARPGTRPEPSILAFVLVFLLPLLVLATSYDLLSGERERGTLALVLSQPVSLATFLLGKVLQRALMLTGFVATLALGGALLAGARLSEPGALFDLGAFLLLVGVYVVFWLALALAVNAWGRSSAANALSLVAAWIALAMVVPGLAGVAVDTLAPTPSRAELVNLAREAAREAGSEVSAIEGNHGLDPGTVGRRAVRVQEELERRVEPVLQRFEAQLALQQRLVDRLRFASPVLLVHEGLTDVAGSGVARHQHFSTRVTRFHDELKEFFASRVLAGKRLSEADYDAMPRFVYDETRSEALARVATGIASMAAMTAVLFGVAMVRLRRSRI